MRNSVSRLSAALAHMPWIHCALVALMCLAPSAVGAKAKLNVNPEANHPKGRLIVKGSGFDANESIEVRWDDKQLLFSVESDASGKFAKQRTKVPGNALPGAHTITANGADGDSSQAKFTVATPWVEFGFTPSGDRSNAYENVISAGNVSKLSRKCTATTGNPIASSPAIANGIVYIGAEKLYALDAANCNVLWTASMAGTQIGWSSPAVANGVVYVGFGNGTVGAFDAITGATLWTFATKAEIDSSPAVANGIVYIGSGNNKLYAFDAMTGAVLWTATTGNDVFPSPAVVNGVVYAASWDRNVYAFDARTGAKLWTATTNGEASSPAVSNGIVYVGSCDHKLYALDAQTGSTLWTAAAGDCVFSAAVANGLVYVSSYDGNVYAFDASTGASAWTAAMGSPVDATPAVANGVVYIEPSRGAFCALDAKTGAVLWSTSIGSVNILGSAAISDGVVYVGSSNHLVYAFSLGGKAVQSNRQTLH